MAAAWLSPPPSCEAGDLEEENSGLTQMFFSETGQNPVIAPLGGQTLTLSQLDW